MNVWDFLLVTSQSQPLCRGPLFELVKLDFEMEYTLILKEKNIFKFFIENPYNINVKNLI